MAAVFGNQYADVEVAPLSELLPIINQAVVGQGAPAFNDNEAIAACEEMGKLEEILYSDGAVYRI